MFDSAITDNHLFSLIKLILENYAKVRLYHLGKEQTAKLTEKRLRKQLTKLIKHSKTNEKYFYYIYNKYLCIKTLCNQITKL